LPFESNGLSVFWSQSGPDAWNRTWDSRRDCCAIAKLSQGHEKSRNSKRQEEEEAGGRASQGGKFKLNDPPSSKRSAASKANLGPKSGQINV